MHRGPQRKKGSSSKNRFSNITFSGYVALHILIAGRRLHMRIQRGDSGLVCWHLQRLEIRASSHPVLRARDDVCAAMTIWNAHLKVSDQHTLHDFFNFWLVFSNLILNCCIAKLDFSFFQRCFFFPSPGLLAPNRSDLRGRFNRKVGTHMKITEDHQYHPRGALFRTWKDRSKNIPLVRG